MVLTDGDLNNIKQLVKVAIDEDETMARKIDISHLPTKEEFYKKMDEVMGELKTIREENTIITGRVSDHGDRIEKLEGKVFVAS